MAAVGRSLFSLDGGDIVNSFDGKGEDGLLEGILIDSD